MCDNLVRHGWSQHNLFLSKELSNTLAAECIVLRETDALTLARVGSGKQTILQAKIRSDQIAWLQAGQSVACDAYLLMMEQVRVLLNQTLYLGLEDYESHFSFYTPGASYSKHLDRFHNDDARTISVVIYLNDNWLTEQGGALRLYPHNLPTQDISPVACRMVVFLSAEMLHEVLPATRDRMSLTGWFRRRSH
jgi:SM-20-related protein